MVLDTYEEIIELLHLNLSERLADYKNYNCNHTIELINTTKYFITHPDFNIYDNYLYIEANRWEILYNQINSLPYFNNFNEFINLIDNHQYQSFSELLFSKGISRIISLKELISEGKVNININNSIYFVTKSNNLLQQDFYPINFWYEITYTEQILVIATWIIYNQIFSDANHRTAHYILNKYLINPEFKTIYFINYIRAQYKFDYASIMWINNMNNLIHVVKLFNYSKIL